MKKIYQLGVVCFTILITIAAGAVVVNEMAEIRFGEVWLCAGSGAENVTVDGVTWTRWRASPCAGNEIEPTDSAAGCWYSEPVGSKRLFRDTLYGDVTPFQEPPYCGWFMLCVKGNVVVSFHGERMVTLGRGG